MSTFPLCVHNLAVFGLRCLKQSQSPTYTEKTKLRNANHHNTIAKNVLGFTELRRFNPDEQKFERNELSSNKYF